MPTRPRNNNVEAAEARKPGFVTTPGIQVNGIPVPGIRRSPSVPAETPYHAVIPGLRTGRHQNPKFHLPLLLLGTSRRLIALLRARHECSAAGDSLVNIMVQLSGMQNVAGGLLALLEEEEQALQVHGLKGLLKCVDDHWAEVSSAVTRIETFYEDEAFPDRKLAALVASKVSSRNTRRRASGALMLCVGLQPFCFLFPQPHRHVASRRCFTTSVS